MFKLLVTLGTFLLVALAVLALRQHRLDVTSQTVKIQNDITARQQSLLDQRAEIARQTNPWALTANLKAAGINTGAALGPSDDATADAQAHAPATPQVETDLTAPVRDDDDGGHAHTNRPRQ